MCKRIGPAQWEECEDSACVGRQVLASFRNLWNESVDKFAKAFEGPGKLSDLVTDPQLVLEVLYLLEQTMKLEPILNSTRDRVLNRLQYGFASAAPIAPREPMRKPQSD